LPRFLREYRGEVPGCPGGVGAYVFTYEVESARAILAVASKIKDFLLALRKSAGLHKS